MIWVRSWSYIRNVFYGSIWATHQAPLQDQAAHVVQAAADLRTGRHIELVLELLRGDTMTMRNMEDQHAGVQSGLAGLHGRHHSSRSQEMRDLLHPEWLLQSSDTATLVAMEFPP